MNMRGFVILILGGSWAAVGGCGTHTSIGGLGDAATGGQGGGGGSMVPEAGTGGQGATVMGLDAHPDVPPACSSGGGSAPWSQPASALSFRAGGSYKIGGITYGFALADVSGDGKVDLVVSSAAGVSLFVNQGDGSLVGPHNSPFGGFAPFLGDLNGDGKTDVALTENAGVSVLINDGNVALEPPVTYVAFAATIALGDLNGDGKTDIVAIGSPTGNGEPGVITVLLNTGGGTFSATSYSTEGSPTSIAIGDLNGDCQPDLVFGELRNVVGRLSLLLNDGRGAFKPGTSYGTGINASSIALVDVSGDGKTDIVAGNGYSSADVLLNYGDGTFAAAVDYPGAAGIAVGDLNGDGKTDIACGAGVLLNKGNGTFAPPVMYPASSSPPYPFSVALADLDGDGKLDVVLGNERSVDVLFNTSR